MKTKTTLGAAAVTGAAAAAAYYLYGSDKASMHRKKVKTWAQKAEREIVREAKQFKQRALTDENIKGVISEVAKRYQLTKNIDAKDIRDFVGTMQKGFREAKKNVTAQFKEMKKTPTKAKRGVKRAVRRAIQKRA